MLGLTLPVAATVLGVAVVLLVGPFVFRATRRARAIDRRLAVLRGQAVAVAPALERYDGSVGGALRKLGLAVLRVGSMLVPVGAAEREKLAQLLRNGGFRQPEALAYFLSVKLAGALALGIGAGLLAAETGAIGGHGFVVAMAALLGLVIGSILPEYGLRTLVARRFRGMTSALPDALDMVVMCLEAGLTVERALVTVADELAPIEPALGREFRQIEAELRLGSDRRAALGEYYRRTEIDGLRDIAMTLIQSERYGTPLSQSMRAIAASERLQKAARRRSVCRC